ncbi:MAG: acyltransferase family protein [Alphaproteobacteria bacterium]|nr:acyltransferase family protein [Alphaproteobacteria bacterium]
MAPVYFLALFLCIVISFDPRYFSQTLGNIFLEAFFLKAWFPGAHGAINGPAWSLCVEAFFYAVFPLILIVLKYFRPKVATFFTITAFIYVLTQVVILNLMNLPKYPDLGNLAINFSLSHFCSFLIGIFVGYVVLTHRDYASFGSGIFWTIAPTIVVALIIYDMHDGAHPGFLGLDFNKASFFSPVAGFVILLVVNSKNACHRLFAGSFWRGLGEASYAIYILQVPMANFFKRFVWSSEDLGKDYNFYFFSITLILFSLLIFYSYETYAKRKILGWWGSLKRRRGGARETVQQGQEENRVPSVVPQALENGRERYEPQFTRRK